MSTCADEDRVVVVSPLDAKPWGRGLCTSSFPSDDMRAAVAEMADMHNDASTRPPAEKPPIEDNGLQRLRDTFEPPEPSKEIGPKSVFAEYATDLNIMKIHEAIRCKVAHDAYKADDLVVRANRHNSRATNASLLHFERLHEEKEAKRLFAEAKEAKNLTAWLEYIAEAASLLEEYYSLATPMSRGTLMVTGASVEQAEENKDDVERRLAVIEQYLCVARRVITIAATRIIPDVLECPACGESLAHTAAADVFGMALCLACGYVSRNTLRDCASRDTARSDASRNSYDDLGNFVKRIDAFECRQRVRPPQLLFTQLEAFFTANPGLLGGRTCEDVRNEACPPDSGKKQGTSVALLEEALSRTHNSAFYRDIELIGHELWGWRAADLSSLRWQLIEDYNNTQRVYDEIKERESSLNVSLRLYAHLRARGFRCELTDFKIVSSKESIAYHDRCLTTMFKRCGLFFQPLMPALAKGRF